MQPSGTRSPSCIQPASLEDAAAAPTELKLSQPLKHPPMMLARARRPQLLVQGAAPSMARRAISLGALAPRRPPALLAPSLLRSSGSGAWCIRGSIPSRSRTRSNSWTRSLLMAAVASSRLAVPRLGAACKSICRTSRTSIASSALCVRRAADAPSVPLRRSGPGTQLSTRGACFLQSTKVGR